MLPVLIGVTVLCFILMTASGKDPALAVAMRSNSAGDTALIASLREEMGLDEPLPARYFLWLKGLLTGDMGKSVVTYHSITDDIKSFFPVTFRLVIMAMGWMILIVFPISMLCARFHNKMFDHIVRLLTIGGICLPVFWLGFMLLLLFAVRLQIFRVAPRAGIKGYILPSFARRNIETSYYEQKTFWSFCSYMVRIHKGIEMLVNLINISYCAMKLLPYQE